MSVGKVGKTSHVGVGHTQTRRREASKQEGRAVTENDVKSQNGILKDVVVQQAIHLNGLRKENGAMRERVRFWKEQFETTHGLLKAKGEGVVIPPAGQEMDQEEENALYWWMQQCLKERYGIDLESFSPPTQAVAKLHEERDEARAELERWKIVFNARDPQVFRCMEERLALERDRDAARKDAEGMGKAADEIERLQAAWSAMKTELHQERNKTQEMEGKIADLEARLNIFEQENARLRQEGNWDPQELETAQEEIRRLEEALEAASEGRRTAEAAAESRALECANWKADIRGQDEEIGRLRQAGAEQRDRIVAITGKVDSERLRADASEELARERKDALEAMRAERDTAQAARTTALATADAVRRDNERLNSELEAVRSDRQYWNNKAKALESGNTEGPETEPGDQFTG